MSSPLTSHVLDTARGRPATGLAVEVHKMGTDWEPIATGETNADGRVPALLTDDQFSAGTYRVTFHTGPWFASQGEAAFYPVVRIVFTVDAPDEHYHIPLLLSPFGYSTYCGS